MLKLVDRRWVSRAVQLKNIAFLHQRHNFGTVAVSRKGRIQTISKAPSLSDVLARLEVSLNYGNRANVDNIMENFRLMHSMNTVIPFAYFQDVANILSAQNDATRLELLIHLCKENMTVHHTKVRQSRPGDDPVDKLVSTAITGLFKCGNRDDASKLWVRMSNNGYVTSRVSMEQMIDRIAGSVDYAPPLQLLNAVHNASKAHLWHQNPLYFAKVLNLVRQNILKDCKNVSSLEKAETVLERMWLDAQHALLYSATGSDSPSPQQLPVELYALRLHCYSAASYVVAQNIGASSEQVASYNQKASSAFTELLERSKAAAAEASTAASAATFAEEIKQILSPYKVDRASSSVNSSPIAPSLSPTGNAAFEGHNSLFTQLGDVRRSSRLFLQMVASNGQPMQAITLLRQYIHQQAGGTGSPTTNASAAAGAIPLSLPAKTKSFLTEFDPSARSDADDAVAVEKTLATSKSRILAALTDRSLFSGKLALDDASTVNTAEDAARKQYSAEERVWQADTVCEIMRKANVVASLVGQSTSSSSAATITATPFERKVFQDLETVFLSLKDVLRQYQLKPGAKFYASFIDALRHNMQYLSDNPPASSEICIPWQASLEAAEALMKDTDPRIAGSAEVYNSLIELLCLGSRNPDPDPAAVLRALELILQKGDDKHRVLPGTLTTVLIAATSALDDPLLFRVLIELERLLESASRRGEAVTESSPLLIARIHAHCRLREGFHALGLMRSLRTLGVRIPQGVYSCVINSLYLSNTTSEWSKNVAADPSSLIEFFVKEMKTDGHEINSKIVAELMRLYTKAAHGHYDKASEESLEKMTKFVQSCSSDHHGVLGAKTVKVDFHIVQELVKVHCITDNFERAKELAENSLSLFGVPSSAGLFEPIVFRLATKLGKIAEAEEVIQQLLNKGEKVTPAISGAMTIALLRHRDARDALNYVQDTHNMHGVSPAPSIWLALLDDALVNKDVMEARRVVAFLQQLHSSQERELLVGIKQDLQPQLADQLASATGDHAKTKEGQRANEEVARQISASFFWNPLAFFKGNSTGGEPTPSERSTLATSQIRLGAPMGQRQRGVLSDSALKERFERYGFSLN